MIDPEEFRAFMAILTVAGQEHSDKIVAAVNVLSVESRVEVEAALQQWVELAQIIAARSDTAGYERGRKERAATAAVQDFAQPAPAADIPKKMPLKLMASGKHRQSDIPAPLDAKGVPHYRADGGRVPENVKNYLRQELRKGRTRGSVRDQFGFSYMVVQKIWDEVQAEKIATIENGAAPEGAASPTQMPPWAVQS